MTWTRQMAHVSQSTSQDHIATAFHFFSVNSFPPVAGDFASSISPRSIDSSSSAISPMEEIESNRGLDQMVREEREAVGAEEEQRRAAVSPILHSAPSTDNVTVARIHDQNLSDGSRNSLYDIAISHLWREEEEAVSRIGPQICVRPLLIRRI